MPEYDPTLGQIKRVQAVFDTENFSGAETPEGKRRHIYLHLGKLLGKFSTIEEQVDHGITDTSALRTDIVPDLIVFAAQLADLEGIDMAHAYYERLGYVASRNGTAANCVQDAFDAVINSDELPPGN